jgi:hypothetical protein
MQKLRKIVNVGVPILLLLLGIFFFFTKDFPASSTGGLNSVGGLLSEVDSLKNLADYWKAESSKSDTVIIKVPTYVYVDRPISMPIPKDKVFPKEVDLNDFDLEDVSKVDEVKSVPVKTIEKSYGSFLKLPYDFTLKNEGVSFDGIITSDSFTIKNLLITSPYEIMPIVSVQGDYQKKSVVFKYASPYLQNLNLSYTESPRLTDKGLKKVKRKV